MRYYASAMGAGRGRDTVVKAGFGFLISPLDPRPVPDGVPYCLDNGAWSAFQKWLKARIAEGMTDSQAMAAWIGGRWVEGMLDEAAFETALERYGSGADFTVLPDIVAGGLASLDFSVRWSNRCQGACDLVLIAVQDGMEPADLEPHVRTRVGIFLGGSTEWKLANAEKWGRWCAERPCRHPASTPERPRTGCWFHFARLNTGRRFRLAHASGADSGDGSSATKFADSIPLLCRSVAQSDLFDPRRISA